MGNATNLKGPTGRESPTPGLVTAPDGTRIAYWRAGRGPVVVVVHGAGNDHAGWEAMVPLLAPSCTVVTIDRRGRGASGDTLPYAFEREFEDVAAVADAFGSVCVLGHSIGTPIALEATLQTQAISSLILYEGWPDAGEDMTVLPDYLPTLDELAAAGRYAEIVEYGESHETIEEMHADPRWSEWVSAAASTPREIRGVYDFWARHPLGSGRWRQLSIPILMLYGEQNPGQGRGAEQLATDVQRARVVELAGQGHLAYREAPQVLAAAVLSFLGSRTDQAG
jgi:pimeloyl-ACP methyl ester carboxylesterase